ncbi:MAG TPA: PAS domain-containing protein [Saprospiraceae bacterium]|nr:PAS domain-containing protein [Saprospiraceae bacterium]HMQ83398.1 PAS domain-containing protein [Saprospiraceae bacterium]
MAGPLISPLVSTEYFHRLLQSIIFLSGDDYQQRTLSGALELFARTAGSDTILLYKRKETHEGVFMDLFLGMCHQGGQEDFVQMDHMVLPFSPENEAVFVPDGVPQFYRNIEEGKRIAANFPYIPCGSNCLIPIIIDDQFWGLLGMAFDSPFEINPIHKDDYILQSFVTSLSNYLARMEAKYALEENERKLQLMIDGADVATWTWYLPERKVIYNKYFYELLGYTPCELNNSKSSLLELIHPDDVAEFGQKIYDYVQIPFHKAVFNDEVRMKTKSGDYKWIICRGRIIKWDNQGKPLAGTGICLDNSATRATLIALKESREKNELTIQAAQIGLWEWDIPSGAIEVSDPWLQMLGYERDEIVPHVDSFFNLMHQEDISKLWSEINQNLNREKKFFEAEIRLKTKSGKWKWVFDRGLVTQYDASGIPIKARGVHLDIDQLKLTEAALKDEKAVQKAILQALPDLKFRMNLDGFFLDFYGKDDHKDLLMPSGMFIGKNIQDILPNYIVQAGLKNAQLAIQTGQVQAFEYPVLLSKEKEHFEARVSAINEQEVVIVIRNITDLKLAQQALRDKIKELDQNNQKLQKYISSNDELEFFAQTVSHDLREPLRTMKSFSQLLLKNHQEKFDADEQTYLNFIASSATEMTKLIEDLLEYSTFHAVPHQGIDTIDLNNLLSNIISNLNELIQGTQAEIQLDQYLPVIKGNKTKISQLFQNLISNAIKFHKPDETPIVTISYDETPTHWQFFISDNGIGISSEYHYKIFTLFSRLHSKKVYPGSGIGLALCKSVVEQHGGTIEVESQEGQGAIFSFTLPK